MIRKILLGLTTTSGSDYRQKVEEIKNFNLTEIAFFPTAINQKTRKELYALLEDSNVESIPHAHLRDDMEVWEVEYLQKKFNTQVFNIHGAKNTCHPFDFEKLKKYLAKIYIENHECVPEEDELKRTAGLCIDFSHWEDAILLGYPRYEEKMREATRRHSVRCSHVSAVGKKIVESRDVVYPEVIYRNYSKHYFSDLSEFDYMKKYSKYLPEFISLELENSFEEQTKVKKYLDKMFDLEEFC